MSSYQICVYAISKNEERHVDRWMDSAGEADLVVVADTGSADSTVEKLRARGAVVYEETVTPWRFDSARNLALDHVPPEMDICVAVDLDECFEPGWRAALEALWAPEYTRAEYRFVWSHHPDGTPEKVFRKEKIHRRQGYRWVHPVHEILVFSGPGPEKILWAEGVVLHHYPDSAKSRGQYLPLLELSARENPQDDRTQFWLGREYFFYGRYNLAEAALKRHLDLPSALWDEERCASMRLIAQCRERAGDLPGTKSWLFRALAECQGVREPYLALVKLGYRTGDWPLSYAMAGKGLAITRRSGSYLTEPESWGPALYDYGSIAAYRMGLYEQALSWAQTALELSPDDPRLRSNLTLIEKKLSSLTEGGASS